MQQLLMIEDDTRLAQMVGEYLGQAGFAFAHATEGGQGLDALVAKVPDLVILDLMLPDMDGLDVCRRIRGLSGAAGRVPVLMLTAKGDPMDRIVGLELGADDYLPKPFEPRELLARIKAVLRRHGEAALNPVQAQELLRFGSLDIGRVLSRDQIMEAVRGRELEAFDRSIDVHMGRIRAAIEQDVKNPKRILTVRGVGYVFARQQD